VNGRRMGEGSAASAVPSAFPLEPVRGARRRTGCLRNVLRNVRVDVLACLDVDLSRRRAGLAGGVELLALPELLASELACTRPSTFYAAGCILSPAS